MSLNWKEIDQILSEWNLTNGKIQQVLQLNPHTLYLEIYKATNNVPLSNTTQQHINRIEIHLANNAVRLHSTADKAKKMKVAQRFQQFLQSRVIGMYITDITHLNQDRIIRLSLQYTLSDNNTQYYLYCKLWSNQANICLTDTNNTIIDLAFRRPKQKLIPGNIFPLPTLSDKKNKRPTQVRAWHTHNSFNEYIAYYYKEKIHHEHKEKKSQQIITLLEKQKKHLVRKQATLDKQLLQSAHYKQFEEYGNLILSYATQIQAHDTTLEISSLSDTQSKNIIIALDATLSPIENAQHYFNQAKKIKNTEATLQLHIEQLNIEYNIYHEIQSQIDNDPLNIVLNEEQKQWLFSKEQRQQNTTQKTSSKKPPIKMLLKDRDFTIMIGRNVSENDVLLRHYVKGNDLWFHIRGYSGAYIFIRCPNKKSVPLDMLETCGQLAGLYSKAKDEKYIDVHYTEVKYLKRIKQTKGLVSPLRDKNLQIQFNKEQIKKYLALHLQS